jgi:hypothetical protein
VPQAAAHTHSQQGTQGPSSSAAAAAVAAAGGLKFDAETAVKVNKGFEVGLGYTCRKILFWGTCSKRSSKMLLLRAMHVHIAMHI